MKKKKFILLPLLALFLSSCLFDTDDDGLTNWLSDQGMPSNYKVQTVTVGGLKPVSAEVFQDTRPKSAWGVGVVGAVSGMSYDLALDFALDSAFLDTLKKADSASSVLYLRLIDSYYQSEYLPSGILPIEEDLNINVSWILSEKLSKSEFKDLGEIYDTTWLRDLESWKTKKTADTTISVSIGKKDSLLVLDLPSALVNDVRKNSGNRRLQVRISAPEASTIYRFYGPGHEKYYPQFFMVAEKKDKFPKMFDVYRSAIISSNHEKCSDCLVLHGGTFDSLVVEFPSKPIMKALSDFYGDDFPNPQGDGNDVRQAVVMAQMTFYRDDSKGESQLGYPIRVDVGSYADSADTVVRRLESYKIDKPRVLESGHPNMVFYKGDSVSLQVTAGMRDFINRASDGRSFKMMMRLAYPVLLDKDTVFYDRVVGDSDTLEVFFPHYDYARYDFTSIKEKSATLKLWLASKRGEKTDKKVATSTVREGK